MRRSPLNMGTHLHAHIHTNKHTNTYTQTLGLRCFWDLLTHLPCAMRLAVSPANSIQLTQRGAQKHTLIQPGGRVRVRTNPCMQTLHTVTLLSPGLECQNEYREAVHVCVCAYLYVCICMCVCSMLTDDMLKADTTHTLPVTAGFITRPRPL